MRVWLLVGLSAILGIGAGLSGCRKYTHREPSVADRSYDRNRGNNRKPVPAPKPPTPIRTLEPTPYTRSTGWSEPAPAGTISYAAPVVQDRAVATRTGSVPPVTMSDWSTGQASYAVASAPALATMVTIPASAVPAVTAEASRYGTSEGPAVTAVPATLKILPPVPEAQRAVAMTPPPTLAPAVDVQLAAARQMMAMTPPTAIGVPRAEVVYASAGAVPAALRARMAGTTVDWTAVELPPVEEQRLFRMPVVSAGTPIRPMAAGGNDTSRWLARAAY